MMKLRLFVLAVIGMLLAVGCLDAQDEAPASLPGAAPPPVTDQSAPTEASDGSIESSRDPKRKLIQTAELHLWVEDYADSKRALEQRLEEVGGYVDSAEVDHAEGRVLSANLVLRVPVEKLTGFLRGATGLGRVTHESLSTTDVSTEYYDIEARLKSARKLESRLLELVGAETNAVKDLLEVERELARVRSQIEQLEGRIRMFDGQVAYSTVTLRISTDPVYLASAPPTLTEQAWRTAEVSARALVGFGRGLLLVLVALAPWLPLMGLVFWALRRVRRSAWWQRRRARQPYLGPIPGYSAPMAPPVQPAG